MTRDNVPGAMYRDSAHPVAEISREFMVAASRLPTLFDLENNAYWLLSLLEEVDDTEAADIQNQLALVDQMLMEKTESYVSVIRSLEAMSAARKAEADRLRDRARSAENHAEWLKSRLLTHMQTTGSDRIETSRFTLTVRQNNPSVTVVDASLVPGEYQRTKIEVSVDKRGILDAFRATGEIPAGVSIERGESLRIA